MRQQVARLSAVLSVAAGLAYLRRSLIVVSVAGASMQPALQPGDRVLVRRRRAGRLRRGTVLVFAEPAVIARADGPRPGGHPRADHGPAQSWVIKRLAALPGDAVPPAVQPVVQGTAVVPDGMIVVLGDAVHSKDSRHWGFIPATAVLGVAVRRLGP